MADNLVPKSSAKYICEKCDFKCSRLSQYQRHLLTLKHTNTDKGLTQAYDIVPKSSKYSCKCGKVYTHRQSLCKHKQICSTNHNETYSMVTTNIPVSSAIDVEKITELCKHMLTQNQDFMKDIVSDILKVMPHIGNTTNNNTNSHNTNTTNNQFNIQMFLNEHCKNAMNLTDFVQSLPITSETYESTIENGLTKTIANMMLNGLNELDILKRPIHCTDASRKTLYVKESDVWEKDNELQHVIDSIKYLSIKHRGMIKTWKEANEGWQENDKLQSRMTNLKSVTDMKNKLLQSVQTPNPSCVP